MPAIFIHKLLAFQVKSWRKYESGKSRIFNGLGQEKKN